MIKVKNKVAKRVVKNEYCEQFDIPYRTVTEWELGHRNAPPYVFRFLEYYIRMQEFMKEKGVEKIVSGEDDENERQ